MRRRSSGGIFYSRSGGRLGHLFGGMKRIAVSPPSRSYGVAGRDGLQLLFRAFQSSRPSTSLLKLRRYLSTRFETAPPKLEVNFRVRHVLWLESDAKETTPAAK